MLIIIPCKEIRPKLGLRGKEMGNSN